MEVQICQHYLFLPRFRNNAIFNNLLDHMYVHNLQKSTIVPQHDILEM